MVFLGTTSVVALLNIRVVLVNCLHLLLPPVWVTADVGKDIELKLEV